MQSLVLVPGLGSDEAVWRPTAERLRGIAECSVGDTLHDDDLGDMARRILAGAPERFALAGVSMGGMVAMEMVRLAPQRITRLALLDTNARADAPARRAYRYLANAVTAFYPDFRRLSAANVGALVHPDASDDVRDELIEMSVRVGAATFRRQNRAVAARLDLRPTLPLVTVPTLVIVGADDRLTPVALSQEIHALVSGSQLRVVADCGHLPPIERPEATAGLLAGWLA